MGVSLDKIFSLFFTVEILKIKKTVNFVYFYLLRRRRKWWAEWGNFIQSYSPLSSNLPPTTFVNQRGATDGRTDGQTGFCMCVWVCVRTTDKREKREIEKETHTHKLKSFKFISTIVFLMKFNLKKKIAN